MLFKRRDFKIMLKIEQNINQSDKNTNTVITTKNLRFLFLKHFKLKILVRVVGVD